MMERQVNFDGEKMVISGDLNFLLFAYGAITDQIEDAVKDTTKFSDDEVAVILKASTASARQIREARVK